MRRDNPPRRTESPRSVSSGRPRSFSPGISAFVAGAVVLFIEIAGSRLLAIAFGSSLYVWSSLITVTLLAIAFGAWLGGRIADQWPKSQTLSLLFLAAGFTLGLAVPAKQMAFSLAGQLDLRVGAIVSAMALYFLPLALLAAVTPVIVRLQNPSSQHLGRTVGWISALGTSGSCFGALATGFFLVPNFQLSRLFLYLSFALALYGVLIWRGGSKGVPVVLLFAWTGCLYALSPESSAAAMGKKQEFTTLETRQSLYGQIRIMEGWGMRLLLLDGIVQGGTIHHSGDSISEYTAAMEVLGFSAVPGAKKILVVGLGAGILPSRLLEKGLDFDAVDINPHVVEMYRKWFDARIPSERLHAEDGRRFLRRNPALYDLIFVDVFAGEEIPTHLVTREAFEEMKGRLTEKGAVVLNYVGSSEASHSKVLATLIATLRAVFPEPEAFAAAVSGELANLILVARGSPGTWSPTADVPWSIGKRVSLSELFSRRVQPTTPYPFLFTDDYCPLDWLDRKVRFTWRRESTWTMQLSAAE